MSDFKSMKDLLKDIPWREGSKWGVPCNPPMSFTGPFYDSTIPEIQAKAKYIPPMAVCKFCGKPIPWEGWSWGAKVDFYPNVPVCKCADAQEEARWLQEQERNRQEQEKERKRMERFEAKVRQIAAESGMEKKFLSRRFSEFQVVPGNREAFTACKAFANAFPPDAEKEKNSLYIHGPMGVGKTHLAASVANELIHRGDPVICMTARQIFTKIRNTYNREGMTEHEILETFEKAPLLIIDDLGKEPATEWSTSTLFEIVNARYEATLPTIITSNYSLPDLTRRLVARNTGDSTTAAATVDRLKEMCRIYQITGDSWRK